MGNGKAVRVFPSWQITNKQHTLVGEWQVETFLG